MDLPIIFRNWSLYGVNDTPPCMYNSRLGHTSAMVLLPVISSILLNRTSVHVGTPEMEVTFSLLVVSASLSILLSHSSISAILRSGTRNQCAQKGEFCNNTALRSPYCASLFNGLMVWLPPMTRPLPVSRSESGLNW